MREKERVCYGKPSESKLVVQEKRKKLERERERGRERGKKKEKTSSKIIPHNTSKSLRQKLVPIRGVMDRHSFICLAFTPCR